ncbi:CcmD family protein [Mucilaginibacter terrenus]|uniref:CcmD family protein n=1 Tax=Mucilaginibacter terrenus TaxID=2482727 RepID=A0A3E2NU51_9SPHI|nr:CcmD family protein [Mucilaginibacter terrenus]RFZ84380.1 CcmD family protein [Mucilaginibacter terrenus]
MKKLVVLAIMLLCFSGVYAQVAHNVEMADVLRGSGKIYVVVTTIAIVFVGLAIYLFSIDRRLTKIEKED